MTTPGAGDPTGGAADGRTSGVTDGGTDATTRNTTSGVTDGATSATTAGGTHAPPSPAVLAELAPTGTLRAGINLSNFLLVSARAPDGTPEGVAPGMARALAGRLGVPLALVPFPRPDALADAAGTGAWDVALLGAEPARAQRIAFTDAYAEIECTFLVRADSTATSLADLDRPGIRISVSAGSAYDLWLARHVQHATLVRSPSIDASLARFRDEPLDALAGLRPRLLADAATTPGTRVLPGRFAAVQQAIGTARANQAGAAFLQHFVAEARRSGLVADLIARHGVQGLSVAEKK